MNVPFGRGADQKVVRVVDLEAEGGPLPSVGEVGPAGGEAPDAHAEVLVSPEAGGLEGNVGTGLPAPGAPEGIADGEQQPRPRFGQAVPSRRLEAGEDRHRLA